MADISDAATKQEQVTAVRAKVDEAPKLGACAAGEREKGLRFSFAHLNDLQARYSDVLGGRSRYSYIAGYLRQLKAAQPTFVLDAGDDYEKGALAELRSLGETTRQMVQALPIDVRTIGNHDFAYGEASVLRDVRLSKHPVLAANVKHSSLGVQPFRPYARFDVGCVKVGVIGLVTQAFGADDRQTSQPFDGVFVHDEHYQTIFEREAKAHRAEVDVLIGLTHLGYADDVALAHRGGKLADVIIGGHTEDLIKEPAAIAHGDKARTWVLQAGHFGEALGQGEIVVGPRGVMIEKYKIVKVDESLPRADDVAELARRIEEAVTPGVHATIGRARAAIPQTKMGELVYRAAASTWNADVAVIGRDLFWAGLPKGEFTLQRLYDTVLVQRQPAGTSGFSSIAIVELTGAELTSLYKAFRAGTYEWFGATPKFDPSKRYRVALDKRAATYPKPVFFAESKLVQGATFAGEMIDALEAFSRARSAKGLTVD